MFLSNEILGKAAVDQLTQRQSAPVLQIGSDKFTRVQLSKIGCFNFQAAARLTHLITNELKVANTRELFYNIGPQHLALPGLGAISLATLGAAFEVRGLGNLADYVRRHIDKGASFVTFVTMKHNRRDAEAAKEERRAVKARKVRRQRAAHELRVERHVERATANGAKVNGDNHTH